MDCENCKWGEVTHGTRTVLRGNVVLNQNGGMNVQCRNSGMTIDMTGDEMTCSGFERKEEEAWMRNKKRF